MRLTWEPLDPELLGYDFLGQWLKEFYSGAPWHEHLKCFICAQRDDFGELGRYGLPAEGEPPVTCCPKCGAELEPFWTGDRARSRLDLMRAQGEFAGYVVRAQGEPVACLWGYLVPTGSAVPGAGAMPGTGMFVDRIMVLPAHRKGIVLLYLLATLVQQLKRAGCKYVFSRTHIDAAEARVLFKRLGFRETGPDPVMPDRTYWLRSLRGGVGIVGPTRSRGLGRGGGISHGRPSGLGTLRGSSSRRP